MRSFLAITEDASDLALLSIDELRTAAGITGGSQDTALKALGLRVASAIMAECNIAVGSSTEGVEATLKQETLTQTFYQVEVDELMLARRHNVVVSSLVEDGTTLDDTDFMVDPESGLVTRLSSDCPRRWCARKVVATYKAGFETIPGDLKQAATDFFRYAYLESTRDPALKSEVVDIPGVERTERAWWVGSVPGQTFEGAVPDIVAGQLKRFLNPAIG
ncbi:hypothetical protein NKG99_03845 [Mesorhizobium sp. M1409]|uniref:hypothetical protein n=1 Tax=Mesorhizobium sp. M1409 TaxID=2957100 RepID=UPI00333911C8